MTQRALVLLAGLGSVLLLAGAFAFQAFGYPPCTMCLWQRWPHLVAILIAGAWVIVGGRALIWLGALAAFSTGAIGIFHTGVERDWWDGPSSCTGNGGVLQGDLLSTDVPMLVMCDQVSWALAGLSMASWNALFSLIICAVWIMAARR